MSWIYYLLEANLYLALFYAVYYLLLRRDTYYQLNRGYLIGSSLLAFVIPILQLGFLKPVQIASEQITQVSFAAYSPVSNPVVNNAVSVPAPAYNYYLILYVCVTILMAISFGIRIFQLSRLAQKSSRVAGKGFRLVEMEDEGRAFSFFVYLFISKKLTASDTIIQHELVHIRQKHSLDIIYLELLKIICWFNPAVYLLQNSIRELHEYIADNQVAVNQRNVNEYTDFLVSNAYGLPEPLLANSFFNKNLLKNRIMMLHQKRSGVLARLKLLVALPMLAGMLCLSTLGFTKNYHVIDLLPASALNNPKIVQPIIPVLPSAPKQPKKFLLTKKGYRYAESVWDVNGKSYLRVSIIGDDSVQNDYFTNTVTAVQVKLLHSKYGYAFPKKEMLEKLMPPENNPTNTENKPELAAPNNIAYIINPVAYNYFTLATIGTKLYTRGYIMNYKEMNKGTDSAMLEISMETSPQIDWHQKVSATFKTTQMDKNGDQIMVGVDLDKKHVFVRSVRKAVADSINKGLRHIASREDYQQLYHYLVSHIKYAKSALENNVQGNIFVIFNVDDDHKIRNVGITKGLNTDQDAEVVRVIKAAIAPDGLETNLNYVIQFSFVINDPATSKPVTPNPIVSKSTYVSDYKITGFISMALNEIIITGFYPATNK